MKLRFDDNQRETVTRNVLDIYVTLVVKGESGQTSYFTLNSRTGMSYAEAASFLKRAKVTNISSFSDEDIRVDIATRVQKYEIVRCWYCDGTNRARLWDMDCDGPYQQSVCERCENHDHAGYGHFGAWQRETDKARNALKYHIPARSWREQDNYDEYGYVYSD